MARSAAWPVSRRRRPVHGRGRRGAPRSPWCRPAAWCAPAARRRCTCLLAPNCLHRVAVLALAPVRRRPRPTTESDAAAAGAAGRSAGDRPPTWRPARRGGPARGATPPGPRPPGRRPDRAPAAPVAVHAGGARAARPRSGTAADGLWRAGGGGARGGVTGCGRGAAYGAAAGGARGAGATGCTAPRRPGTGSRPGCRRPATGEPHFRLADLTDELRELLTVSHRLRAGTAGGQSGERCSARPAAATTRRPAFASTACARCRCVAESGYAGTVTYVVDRDGRLWMVTDLMPGDARPGRPRRRRHGRAGRGRAHPPRADPGRPDRLRGHRRDVGTLGAGKSVRAVTAAGAAWTEEPLAGAVGGAARRAGRAGRSRRSPCRSRTGRPASDLVFLSVRCVGAGDRDARARRDRRRRHGADADGSPTTTRRWRTGTTCGCSGAAAGLELLVVGRPDPARRAPCRRCRSALAPGTRRRGCGCPQPGPATPTWDSTGCTAASCCPGGSTGRGRAPPATGDPALELLRRHLERVVAAAGPCTRSPTTRSAGCGGPGWTSARTCWPG